MATVRKRLLAFSLTAVTNGPLQLGTGNFEMDYIQSHKSQ